MNTLMIENKPCAMQVVFDESMLTVLLKDGRKLVVPINWYPRLVYALPDERMKYEIWNDGEVLVWPLLDEHIGLSALLAGRQSQESKSSLEKWENKLDQRRNVGETGPWILPHPLPE